jgi:hypothetical protein
MAKPPDTTSQPTGLGRRRTRCDRRWPGRVGWGRRTVPGRGWPVQRVVPRRQRRARRTRPLRQGGGRGLRIRQRHVPGRQRRRWTGSGRRSGALFRWRGHRVERVTGVEGMPDVPEVPELSWRLTLAVRGVRDLWHRWRAGGWGRGWTHRSVRRRRNGLSGRGSRPGSGWHWRRVGHRRIRCGRAGQGEGTAGDDRACDRDPGGVRG